jgi:hypothetical protein
MSLTPEQILRVANAHILDGIDQHKLASLFGVNQGRIAEAVGAVRYAMDNHALIYKVATGKATISNGDHKE